MVSITDACDTDAFILIHFPLHHKIAIDWDDLFARYISAGKQLTPYFSNVFMTFIHQLSIKMNAIQILIAIYKLMVDAGTW